MLTNFSLQVTYDKKIFHGNKENGFVRFITSFAPKVSKTCYFCCDINPLNEVFSISKFFSCNMYGSFLEGVKYWN